MKFLFALILFYCLISCQTNEEGDTQLKNQSKEIKPIDDFESYKKLFLKEELPVIFKSCDSPITGLYQFDGKSFSKFSQEYSLSLNQVPSNGNYIALITLAATECYLPILTTYDNNGEKIDEKKLSLGYCGSDCGYDCSEFMIINEDYTIYVSDTISSSECDSLGQIIPNTTENYVIYKEGELLKNGRIEFSKEIKVFL